MGAPAAKQGDLVVAVDVHVVILPVGPPVPLPHPFSGGLDGGLSSDVRIMGRAAATVDSTADNVPPHLPTPPGVAFQRPPANRATIAQGSPTVRINGRPAARVGDRARTCNDPTDLPVGVVVGGGSVVVG